MTGVLSAAVVLTQTGRARGQVGSLGNALYVQLPTADSTGIALTHCRPVTQCDGCLQESGHTSANDIIPLDAYRDHLFRLTDMARGDASTRVFLATDDPEAEADLRSSFAEGVP